MNGSWGTINAVVDNVVIIVGVAVLIVRQFLWRSAQLHRMLTLPILLIAIGLVYLAFEMWGGFRWVAGDWFIFGELGLVAITGVLMGLVTRFRTSSRGMQYRLSAAGIALWALFIGLRVGFILLAAALHANLAEATGIILVSFGVNRFAAVLVVQRRVQLLGEPDFASDSYGDLTGFDTPASPATQPAKHSPPVE